MDIKWKNNKKGWVAAVVVVLIITCLYRMQYPAFARMASRYYEDPMVSDATIRALYQSNYIQYKYLKERVDQKKYSYQDLYFDMEKQDLSEEETENTELNWNGDTHFFDVENVEDVIQEYRSEMNQTLEYWEEEITQPILSFMEYYAEDTQTGVSLSNSGSEELKMLAQGEQPDSNPYVYYVKMEYDSIGNIINCGVRTTGNAEDFLKNVQLQGRSTMLYPEKSNTNSTLISLVDEFDGEVTESYQLTYAKPENMVIIYALTEAQYNDMISNQKTMPMADDFWYSYYQSYIASGVISVVVIFLLAALGIGMALPIIRRNKGYDIHKWKLFQLPAEIYWIAACVLFGMSSTMVEVICDERIYGSSTIVSLFVPFLFFTAAFIVGGGMCGMHHFRAYVRKRSILYRYWDKICNYIRKFYQELVTFDIGADANKIIVKLVLFNFLLLSVLCTMWIAGIFGVILYSVILYFLLKKYVKDIQNKYQNLLYATSAIARGNLDNALSENFGVFESYKSELRQIQTDFKKAVEEEVKSQRMKSELITNVSHDLKTPLTAIITYIDLLKEPNISEAQRAEYLRTLDKKALRLKVLIEDLFEVSKANSRNITLHFMDIDICNLLRQVYLEHEDKAEKLGLDFRFQMPEYKVMVSLDSQKAYRIFENLYVNITKYAMEHTRVYVVVAEEEDEVHITIKNISRSELDVPPEELTERFVRGDGSRNTEGSGLGLAIAKSFTELQNGRMELEIDGDLFKVLLTFPKAKPQEI